MSKLKIKNFGPIKIGLGENWIVINKVTIFIGNQGSGKSTIAKVYSTLSWVEKAVNRGDFGVDMTNKGFRRLFDYQNLMGYFRDNTEIEYDGDILKISYDAKNKYLKIDQKNSNSFVVPKIMYVPAERNFLSVIKNATGVRGLPEPLFEFAEELKRGQNEFKSNKVPLPINDVYYKYDHKSDSSFITGKDFNVNLLAASSGFQSIVPLYIVSLSLSQIINSGSEINPDNISVKHSIRMSEEISKILERTDIMTDSRVEMIDEIIKRFQNRAFVNIVEEPEQNLFPESQWELLKKLFEFNNMNNGNKLILTTHSPYLINFTSIAIQAGFLKNEIKNKNNSNELMARLEKVISSKSIVSGIEVFVYQLNVNDGSIIKLPMNEGIPSDNNYLYESLRHGNEMFDCLLEIEQELEL